MEPKIEGVTVDAAAELLPDKKEVWARGKYNFDVWRRYHEERRKQKIVFDQARIGLVWMADLHLGDDGVDYQRLENETILIRDTPNMYSMLGGDATNNFIYKAMTQIRNGANFSIPNEFGMLSYWLDLSYSKLIAVLAGNHDNWFSKLTGIDYFREQVAKMSPAVLYDQDEIVFTLVVGGWERIVKARHKWRGFSQYNNTHAIQKSTKFGNPFHIGLGAHLHSGGFTQQFDIAEDGGRVEAYALLAGAYKIYDGYARACGYEETNPYTAVGIIVDGERHTMTGYTNLEAMAYDLKK